MVDEQHLVEISGLPLAPPDVRSLAALLFAPHGEPDDRVSIVLGTLEARPLAVSLRTLRRVTLALQDRLAAQDLRPGDTVCLIRLPRTSETLAAVLYLALSVIGLRTLFPMYVEPKALPDWLRRTRAKAVLWSAHEAGVLDDHDPDRALFRDLQALVAAQPGVRPICLWDDLDLPGLLTTPYPSSPGLDDPRVVSLLARSDPAAASLILTTSGTTGRARLVEYTQGAFLLTAAAWQQAGLFGPGRMEGRGLCLLLAHSMGLRQLWNALWTREACCLLPPEWFIEHPERTRAFLQDMAPRHVAGGPAVFRTLLELARVFPQLKDDTLRGLSCGLSIGATFDPALSARLDHTFGLPMHSGFGMTEGMLLASTLMGGARVDGSLGRPLPGVGLRLTPAGDGAWRLEVASPFGASGYLDDDGHLQPFGRWLATGDLVTWDGDHLGYVGREGVDFFKDGFGVKIARQRVEALYAGLPSPILHIEPFPLTGEPGLLGVVWIGRPPDPEALRDVTSVVEARNERLRRTLEELEFRHLTLARIQIVPGLPPRTAKGNVSRAQVVAALGAALADATGLWRLAPGRARLDRTLLGSSDLARWVEPHRGALLRLARLDQDYHHGHGDRLQRGEGAQQVEVIDFVGGFGGNLLGHRHPRIVAAARAVLEDDRLVPVFDQGSARTPEAALARRLAARVSQETGRSYVAHFSSTGAEAVEIALAHAFFAWRERVRRAVEDQLAIAGPSEEGRALRDAATHLLDEGRPVALAVEGSFHGYTLGARGLLHASTRRTPFAPLLRMETRWLPRDGSVDPGVVARELEVELPGVGGRPALRISRVFAAFAEPVQGEGGVAELPDALLQALCGQPWPLILDEIQCGLGRTGTFLAAGSLPAGAVLLSKALGGGVAKIGAVLIDRGRYMEAFDEQQASTFAGDALSCAVAGAVLDVIDDEDVPGRCRDRGTVLRARLAALAAAFPDVIHEVRGRGLLLGVDLRPAAVAHSLVLRGLVHRELLGVIAAGWLLHHHRLRLLPTLSAPSTLRVEPSAWVDDAAIDQLCVGLAALAAVLRAGNARALLDWLVYEDAAVQVDGDTDLPPPTIPCVCAPPPPEAARVGFLFPFIHPEAELASVEPTLGSLSLTARRALFHRLVEALERDPFPAWARTVLGGRAWMQGWLMPLDAAMLEEDQRAGDLRAVLRGIQRAVDRAAADGCRVMALGAGTSIVTGDGTAVLSPPGCRVTSGNSFTAAVVVARARAAWTAGGLGEDDVLLLLGATGNIGHAVTLALCAAPGGPARVRLFGRRQDRLEALAAELRRARAAAGRPPLVELSVHTDLGCARQARMILATTHTNERLLYPDHLGPGPVWVGDVAVPGAVASSTWEAPQVRPIELAGVVPFPGEPDFRIATTTPAGTLFCCAAEALLVALHPEETAALRLVGPVDPVSVRVLGDLGRAHGLLP